jgi:hypothetical protein
VELVERENLELKRRIHTFESPKLIPVIENEEMPQFESNMALTREQFIERLSVKNEILMAQVEYFGEKVRLGEMREMELLKENEQLEQSVKNLMERFYSLQVLELGKGSSGKWDDQAKVLQARLEVAEESCERSSGKNKKMREMIDCLNEYCKRLEERVGKGLIEERSVQDQLMGEIEVSNVDNPMDI